MVVNQGYQAEARVDQFEGQKALIKRAKGNWLPGLRQVGTWMLKREAEVLDRLEPVDTVPDFLGFPDDQSIAMEFIEGKNLRELDDEDAFGELPESFFKELYRSVNEIHERGVVHSDLKKKENIMVTPDRTPVIIDFGAAFRRKSAVRVVNNFIYEQFRTIDQHAVLKLKYLSRPDLFTDDERDEVTDLNLFESVSRWGRWVLPFRQDPPPLSQRYD